MLENKPNKPVIFGCSGVELTKQEAEFFEEQRPLGFILFSRNIDNPEQTKQLVSSLKESVGWDCPILIDQEGGRVARLSTDHWPKFPAMDKFADLYQTNRQSALDAVYENSANIANQLIKLGVNVNCAPVCDLLIEGADGIIGDRSFGGEVEQVVKLARKSAEGLIDNGVTPIIKHIPGHGRASCDSHKKLPVVDESLEVLNVTDFEVFRQLNDIPWAMTAHIVYSCLDDKPATQSSKVIEMIRKELGFDGIIISDDLSMEALIGSYQQRAEQSLEAGCDLVLHCNGKFEQMVEVVAGAANVSSAVLSRYINSLSHKFKQVVY